jgi:hypothetical protein
MLIISWSVCPWQDFSAWSNVCRPTRVKNLSGVCSNTRLDCKRHQGSITSTFLHATFSRERQISCLFLKTHFTIPFRMKNVCNVCGIFFEIGEFFCATCNFCILPFIFPQSLIKLTPGIKKWSSHYRCVADAEK